MKILGYCFFVIAVCLAGCGHTHTSKVGLLSIGDLNGKTIPAKAEGPVLEGKDCAEFDGSQHFLSNAVRNALKGTENDTLIDAEVTDETGLLVTSNCISVKGIAINSKSLEGTEGGK